MYQVFQGYMASQYLCTTVIYYLFTIPFIHYKIIIYKQCLYQGIISDKYVLLLRKMHNFAVVALNQESINIFFGKIQEGLTQSLKLFGVLTIFNEKYAI